MKVVKPFRTGRLVDCDVGTLVAIEGGHNARLDYAIVLQKRDSLALLGIVKSRDSHPPFISLSHLGNNCLIFGIGWIFEILPEYAALADINSGHQPGSVTIEGDNTYLRFGRGPNESNVRPAYINMETFAHGTPADYMAVVAKWRIWRDEAHRVEKNSKPLVEFGVVGPALSGTTAVAAE